MRVAVGPEYVRVEGWAGQRKRVVQSVWLTVDGVPRAIAERGRPTPRDAQGAPLTDFSPDAGWVVEVRRADLPTGEVTFGGLVLQGYGMVESFTGTTVTLSAEGLFGALELPSTGAVVGDMVVARGWVRTALGVDRVEVQIGDHRPVRARLQSQPRPDLLSVLPDADAGVAGWEASIRLNGDDPWFPPGHPNATPLSDGPWELTATAVLADRSVVLGTVEVEYRPVDRTVRDESRARVVEARTELLTRSLVPGDDGEHLLVVTHHLGLGGGQLYLQELLRVLLTHDDIRCTVIAPQDGTLRRELEDLGARVHVVGSPPTTAVEYEEWMHSVVAYAVTTGCTSVVANTAGCYWGVDLADRLGLPSVWAVHESFAPEHFLEVGFAASPDAWVAGRFARAFAVAGRVVFEADATLELFRHLVRDHRAVRVDYGIDVEEIDAFLADHDRVQLRRDLGIAPDETVLMCMGTYEPRKAQAILVSAFARLVDDHPRAVLVLVGDAPGAYSDAVHDLVRRLGIGDRVRLVPVTPHIADWYVASDAMVLASDIESLSRAMLESMAYGTPVVVSSVFGHAEAVEDGVTGFLLEQSSLSGVTRALRRFLRLTREERGEVAVRARKWVEDTRGSEGYAQEYRRIIAKLRAEDVAS